MSHDTDKLIRQLSLVAFLMAERRPLTARDVKGNVEGYSEMSDEAFARRFYSDRAELIALGVPLHSQRDEFTGEELYTLRSENYFLERLELDDDELAALQTALYLLEGTFAYAEPLRLALQNLALGRPGFDAPRTQTAAAVERARLQLLLDEPDCGAHALGHRPGDLRLRRDREVAPDVLEERPIGLRKVVRVRGEPLHRLLALLEHRAARLELRRPVRIGVDQVLDRAIDRARVLIHTGLKLLLLGVDLRAHRSLVKSSGQAENRALRPSSAVEYTDILALLQSLFRLFSFV